MPETYCGKTCAECVQKEKLNCPGCKPGPGRQYGGDCELAQCCRSKGHENCDTCIFRGNCGTLSRRENMPDYRRRKSETEELWKAAIARRAPVLGKWLWILFWLIIPGTIAGFMTNESIAEWAPDLYLPGQILNAIYSAAYGLILVKLASEEDRYKTAGICALIAGAVSVGVAIISGTGESPAWTLVLTLPASVVSLVGEHNEYMGHANVLTGVDNELSEKWEKLWYWYIGLFGIMIGSILVMFLIPFLGALAILAAAIGVIVVRILKLVYLYRTAKLFREYQG